ncbi:sushi, nidogen and EGF-like domain-containing protein 1 isoform X1 [Danio rerio]|uniref:Sushi, nidogen and EGF-like domain-containing protein 1 isoform X1 n=2 Tax=Danio rerio TaxID=7955 RepID=A0A8M6YWL2_DANRE|nr:sushi, nidogen and EGF-like domain-containing protein 1 isoform X1 [Danio rerio]|eukprot:XP_017210066.1 sushi, nidogen and EGF-like domain-containing protein 1 isoform X1 [Danio rerio]
MRLFLVLPHLLLFLSVFSLTRTQTSAPSTYAATTPAAVTQTTAPPTPTPPQTKAPTTPLTTTTSPKTPTITPPRTTVTTSPTSPLPAPQIFYPFGSAAGDSINPAADDGGSSVIPLLSPFLYFGRTYQQIYVNNNGDLTFSQNLEQYVPYVFPGNGSQDIIAGLWTDLDNRERGVVSYNQYTNGSVLTRATQDINNYFPYLTFTASWVFVATWDKVAYYPVTDTKTSFQMVLISDSSNSFVLMNYGDIAVAGQQVEAGYDTINSTNYFVIPGSNNGISISNLQNSSNVSDPGRWVFRVDGGPETNRENVVGLQADLVSFLDLTESANMQIVLQQIKQELVKKGLPSNINLELRKIKKINP